MVDISTKVHMAVHQEVPRKPEPIQEKKRSDGDLGCAMPIGMAAPLHAFTFKVFPTEL